MSKEVAAAAIRGAKIIVNQAEDFLNKAVKEKGEEQRVEFPETAFFLPMAYALLGFEVKTVKEIFPILTEAKSLLHSEPSNKLWLPFLGDALDAGIATLLAEEIIVALRYLYGQEPQEDCVGFYTDTWMRSYGIQLVDGRMPGFAAILGVAPTNKIAVDIVREFQKRNIMCFVGSNVNGKSIIDQLKEENVEMGWETYIVPFGRDTISAIYPLNWAIRSALTFGGLKKGQARECLEYCKNRVFAFGLTLGEVDDVKYATGAGAINMGFPIIADTDIPQIRPSGICTYEHLVKELDHSKIVACCIETRGVKVKVAQIPIPVAYSAAFEGERVRREQMFCQFGGKYSEAFEFVRSKKLEEIEEGKIEVIGTEIDNIQEGSAAPLGILVEVAGRKMQKDFEPILERQIHTFLNEAMGIFHMGQRNMCWLRISKDAHKKGFKIKHFGVILHARIHETFGAIVDKVQVTIYTKKEDVEKILAEAKKVYDERDARMAGMTDESVDTFYSCTLCVPQGEEIIFSDGSFRKIENVVKEVVENKDVDVLSFDTTKLVAKPVGELFINPAPRLLQRIYLTNGNYLTLTANHKVLVDTKEGLEWVRSDHLKKGDVLISAKKTNDKIENNNYDFYIVDFLPEEIRVYDNNFLDYLKVIILSKYKKLGRLAKEMDISYGRFYRVFYNSSKRYRLMLGEIKKIIDKLGLDWNKEKKKINIFGTTKSKGYRLYKKKIDEDIMYLSGLVASDGCVRRKGKGTTVQFTNSQDTLIEEFSRIIYSIFKIRVKKFHPKISTSHSKDLTIKSKKPITVAVVNNSVIGRLMIGLGIGLSKEIKEKWTGEIISQFPENLIKAFLRGLFDGDGHVTKTHVLISTGTHGEAQHILLLLKKLDISSYIAKTTRGFQVGTRNFTDYINFRNRISSYHPEKRLKMNRATFSFDKNHVVRRDAIPLKCGQTVRNLLSKYRDRVEVTKLSVDYKTIKAWEKSRCRASKDKFKLFLDDLKRKVDIITDNSDYQELLKWANSNVTFEKVKSTKLIEYKQGKVYNFSVADTHNYMVNGIIVSNCQSFAPNHLCIVKPERLGLCGAYTWLDAKASFELNPAGPNQPVKKGAVIDAVRGEWQGVNEFIYQKSNKTLERFHGYSIITYPETSCGCFECIVALLPEANGFMVVNREYSGMTPSGMSFSTLAGSVGGGAQTPGFMGIGRLYIVSKKFISADGSLKRLVWMTKELKEALGEKLKKRCKEEGDPDLLNKIADESVATTPEQLLEYLQKVNHPALKMPSLL